tara:strand:+ start:1390 stop:1542 length:153 start_codon:yes stop_codon:yes gene_type:complete
MSKLFLTCLLLKLDVAALQVLLSERQRLNVMVEVGPELVRALFARQKDHP